MKFVTTDGTEKVVIEKDGERTLIVLGLRQDADEEEALEAARTLANVLQYPQDAVVDVANAQVRPVRVVLRGEK